MSIATEKYRISESSRLERVGRDPNETRPASWLEEEFLTLAHMIDEIKAEYKAQPTDELQAALARISTKISELTKVVETAHILGK